MINHITCEERRYVGGSTLIDANGLEINSLPPSNFGDRALRIDDRESSEALISNQHCSDGMISHDKQISPALIDVCGWSIVGLCSRATLLFFSFFLRPFSFNMVRETED